MKKIIKKYGNSIVIKLSPEELEILGIKEGDVVDIEINSNEKKKKGAGK